MTQPAPHHASSLGFDAVAAQQRIDERRAHANAPGLADHVRETIEADTDLMSELLTEVKNSRAALTSLRKIVDSVSGPGPWVVVVTRDQIPSVTLFTKHEDAETYFENAACTWNESFLGRAIRYPQGWKDTQ